MLTHLKSKQERATNSSTDTIQFTPNEASSWPLAAVQRNLHSNERTRQVTEEIRSGGGVIPGLLTFSVYKGVKYLLDGQHRRDCFLRSECKIGYADVRYVHHATLAEQGEEFVRLNSSLVPLRPDDKLRAMEPGNSFLQRLRKSCPWVGYDSIRRGPRAAVILSMSMVLRCWNISKAEVPISGGSSLAIAKELEHEEVNNLVAFLLCAMEAWGRDHEYMQLWKSLNMALAMWLFRRTVIEVATKRTCALSMAQAKKVLESLSADKGYLEWLVGRHLSDFHRAPCYRRMTTIMAKAVAAVTGKKAQFPRPAWALGGKGR